MADLAERRCQDGGESLTAVELPERSLNAAKARELVMAHGCNATAYQILNPGMSHWFSARGNAVVGYVSRGSWLLAAGEPICAPENLAETIACFEAFARGRNRSVCYVCAAESMRQLLADSPEHSGIAMGAQPVWNPAEWRRIVRSRRSLRAQLSRSANKGVRIESQAPADDGDGADEGEIRRTLLEWLQNRRLPPMHFLVEPEVLSGVVDDRILLVARREGRVVAFLVASPVTGRNGFLIEELARSPRAPNGTSELLIDAAMNRFAEAGCTYATMGLVALADGTTCGNPLWLRGLMHIARAHANRFYNFRGLERFRAKMHPSSWERLYAISNERRFSPQALYAIGGAFSGISPVRAIGIAVMKGAREELKTLMRKLSK
jgi:phosphatidylglycerol lysyltransferase